MLTMVNMLKSGAFWQRLLPLPILSAALSLAAYWLLGQDSSSFLVWWLDLLVIGLMFWPLSRKIFHGSDTNLSYLPAKAAGLGLFALLHWTGGYLLKIDVSDVSVLILLLLLMALIWGLSCRFGDWRRVLQDRPKVMIKLAAAETGFALLLLAGAYARTLKPDLDSLEKFMNMAFINSILRSDGLPAADPWFAGGSINYYYFGHYIYALLTRLSGLKPEVAYNLGMATLWAFAGSLSFSLGSTLAGLAQAGRAVANGQAKAQDQVICLDLDVWTDRLKACIGGILTWFLVTVGGNGQSFFYSEHGPGRVVLKILAALDVQVGDFTQPYWFPNATRFIGYNPETADKTIHEFPFYSFLVADLHAHVINLTFVLLLLILLTGLLSQAMETHTQKLPGPQYSPKLATIAAVELKSALLHPELIGIGLLLAIFMMANYWDFIIYLPVILLALFSCSLIEAAAIQGQSSLAAKGRLNILAPIRRTSLQVLAILVLAFLCTWPFNAAFIPMSSQIARTVAHSPVFQLLILWGAPVLAGLIWITALVRRHGLHISQWLLTDWIAIALFAYALALILTPELVYVVDIYSGDFKRANTMFKFTYQAFVLLGIVWSYAIGRVFAWPGKNKIVAVLIAALIIIPAWYPALAARQWLGSFGFANQKGLDGLAPLGAKDSVQVEGNNPGELVDDLAAIAWFNENVKAQSEHSQIGLGQPVILEAAGYSYTDAERISTFTGLPTVIGWETHEWLWRTSASTPEAYPTVISPRQNDVRTLYTTTDQALRQQLIDQYRISYIVVGGIERMQYENQVQVDLIRQMGSVVFSRPTLEIIKVG